ncbi:hypothetical protein RIR_jg18678.t1 [Rhizophagus irregularis DAOM 181602=DAOM 197198]|nr:hypothetical protein RIR_jg18678.t1 [Rhizophagus irregularis DAOM 181602=DAOM 197198]
MNKGRRKRIAANILNEYNNLSSSTSERTYAEFTTRKLRSKVLCYCSNCNGKMIDPRIKERHEQTNSLELLNSDKALTSQESKTGTLRDITEVEQVAESTEYNTDDIYTSESSIQEDSSNNDD